MRATRRLFGKRRGARLDEGVLTSDRELVVTRTFNAPARIVFEAWTKPELFKRWWVPKSMGMSLLTCEMDVRIGASIASCSASVARS
jgi:uncharacterized protein YndB with AHSA1/START domain